MTRIFFCFFFLVLSLSTSQLALSQEESKLISPRPKASPLAMASFLAEDNTYLKVTYGQPMMKSRQIFGGLVPYGEIWRLGANEATEITTTKDIRIEKKTLPAGTYTMFAIPEEGQWTVIFNKVLGQWGAYKYEENKGENVMSVRIPTEASSDTYEGLTMFFEQTRKGADLVMVWEQSKILLPITFLNK
jgi:hypothetical protein